jgi:HAD superfamily hydrolase (TIGR01549 family)
MLDRAIADALIIVVDFDGTLVRLETDWQALRKDLEQFCLAEFQEKESFERLDSGLNKIRGSRGPLAYKRLLEIVSRYETEGYRGRKINYVVDALIRLQRPQKIAIFSSNCRKTIERIIPELGLEIDYIVAKEDTESPKPDGEGLRKILRHYAVKPEQAIFVGDNALDLLAGKSAAVRTILWNDASA